MSSRRARGPVGAMLLGVIGGAALATTPAQASHITTRAIDRATSCSSFHQTPDGPQVAYVEYAAPLPGLSHDARVTGTLEVAGSRAQREAVLGDDHVAYFRHSVPATYTYSFTMRAGGRAVQRGAVTVTAGEGRAGCTETALARVVAGDYARFRKRVEDAGGAPPAQPAPATEPGGTIDLTRMPSARDERWGYKVTSNLTRGEPPRPVAKAGQGIARPSALGMLALLALGGLNGALVAVGAWRLLSRR